MTEVLIKYFNIIFLFFILVQVDFTSGEDHAARIRFPDEVSGPDIKRKDFLCGYKYICAVYYASVEQTGEQVHMYYLNKTAKRLQREGFNVTVMEMYGDSITNMSFTNGTFSDALSYNHLYAVAPAGGEPAEKERAQYMAQLGSWIGDKIAFLCDGVLINRKWVLTAAHCFTDFIEPNLVRLGDYDITVPPKSDDDPAVHGKRIEDYPIGDVIFHPEYNPDERYHDLALIPLPQKTPDYSPSINPACLPWDSGTGEDLVGQEVVLTGWGATMYGKQKTPLLQQVKLKVFDSQTCNQTYSYLPNFFRKHPQGLDNENILCVGWEEDGKDACDGDSGAPIVSDKGRGFTVVGIVSGGYGCGLKDYPGLYIPINKPKYLNWIKEVAFSDYN